jgi:hypothetical protein
MTVSNTSVRSVVNSIPHKYSTLALKKTTTSDVQSTLTSDGQNASASNQIIFLNDSTYTFNILVVARRSDIDGENAGWEFKGVAIRNMNAASTTILGVSKTTIHKTTPTWDCNIVVDTVYGGLSVKCVGQSNKTIKWVATVNIVEVTG